MPTRKEPADRPLLEFVFVVDPPMRRKLGGLRASVIAHLLAVGAVAGIALLRPDPLPSTDGVRILLYDPPPPPPAPLPKGSELAREPAQRRPATPEREPKPEDFTAPKERPREAELEPESGTPEDEQAGVAEGSDIGTPDGMRDGVEGGQVGGLPDGVLGGVVGGTGDVVPDYDRPPRLVRQIPPDYPQDAFVKKIEGTVVVEFVIGADGSVRDARVVRSVPQLDRAAVACVRRWIFEPAFKNGRPVASRARAPIKFAIY